MLISCTYVEGKYIEGYNEIKYALELKPENEEAIKLKDELLPLYQEQTRQKEEEEAEKKAEEEAKAEADRKAKEEAEIKAKAEAEAKADAEAKAQLEEQQGSYSKLNNEFSGDGYLIKYPSNYKVERNVDGFDIFTEPNSGANISITTNVEHSSIKDVTKSDIERGIGETLTFFTNEIINGIEVIAYDYYDGIKNTVSVFVYHAPLKNYMVIYQRDLDIDTQTELDMVQMLTTFQIQ